MQGRTGLCRAFRSLGRVKRRLRPGSAHRRPRAPRNAECPFKKIGQTKSETHQGTIHRVRTFSRQTGHAFSSKLLLVNSEMAHQSAHDLLVVGLRNAIPWKCRPRNASGTGPCRQLVEIVLDCRFAHALPGRHHAFLFAIEMRRDNFDTART
jgi:hypothetical protein